MSQQILQVNLKFSIPRTDLETAWLDAAQPIADTPGLLWKVWLMNEAESEAGGIYLFENGAAVRSYLGGPIVADGLEEALMSDTDTRETSIRVAMEDVRRHLENGITWKDDNDLAGLHFAGNRRAFGE